MQLDEFAKAFLGPLLIDPELLGFPSTLLRFYQDTIKLRKT